MKNNLRRMLVLMLTIWTVLPLFSQFRRDENGLVIRKNIDDLDPIELATYEHAIQILKDRSNANPFDLAGYAWQAWVHNKNRVFVPVSEEIQRRYNRRKFEEEFDNQPEIRKKYKSKSDRWYYDWASERFDPANFSDLDGIQTDRIEPGPCLHHKSEFLFWHRAEFFYFEQILQATDPEGSIVDSRGNKYATVDLGIPYWEYTSRASGKRYPTALERSSSVLNHLYRAQNMTTRDIDQSRFLRSRTKKNCKRLYNNGPKEPNSKAQLLNHLKKEIFFVDEDESTFQEGLESQMHDNIHGIYVGGATTGGQCYFTDEGGGDGVYPSMRFPRTAAYDPIFYSFHSFIDFALDAWIARYKEEAIPDSIQKLTLYATQPTVHDLPQLSQNSKRNMGKVSLYLSSEDLGYRYDSPLTDRVMLASEEILRELADRNFARGKSADWMLASQGSSFVPATRNNDVFSLEIKLNPADIERYQFLDVGPEKTEKSYQVEVYLHPSEKNAEINKAAFRKKYLAGWGTYWAVKDHHHGGDSKITISISDELNDLINDKKFQGEDFTITTNLSFLSND